MVEEGESVEVVRGVEDGKEEDGKAEDVWKLSIKLTWKELKMWSIEGSQRR